MCDVVCVVVCDVVCDVVGGVEGGGKVEWLILSCLGVLITDRQTNERTLVIVESLSRLKIPTQGYSQDALFRKSKFDITPPIMEHVYKKDGVVNSCSTLANSYLVINEDSLSMCKVET